MFQGLVGPGEVRGKETGRTTTRTIRTARAAGSSGGEGPIFRSLPAVLRGSAARTALPYYDLPPATFEWEGVCAALEPCGFWRSCWQDRTIVRGQEPEKQRVFHLDSYFKGYGISDDTAEGLRSVLRDKPVQVSTFYMDTKRHASDAEVKDARHPGPRRHRGLPAARHHRVRRRGGEVRGGALLQGRADSRRVLRGQLVGRALRPPDGARHRHGRGGAGAGGDRARAEVLPQPAPPGRALGGQPLRAQQQGAARAQVPGAGARRHVRDGGRLRDLEARVRAPPGRRGRALPADERAP